MALLSVDFFSDVLEVGASMSVVWPQATALASRSANSFVFVETWATSSPGGTSCFALGT